MLIPGFCCIYSSWGWVQLQRSSIYPLPHTPLHPEFEGNTSAVRLAQIAPSLESLYRSLETNLCTGSLLNSTTIWTSVQNQILLYILSTSIMKRKDRLLKLRDFLCSLFYIRRALLLPPGSIQPSYHLVSTSTSSTSFGISI